MKIYYFLFLTILIFLSSCTPKVNLKEYTKTKQDLITANQEIPKYIIEKRKPKVAVLPLSSSNYIVKKCGLAKTAQEYTISALEKLGSVEVIERSELDKIMQELQFQESIGKDINLEKLSKIGENIDFALVGAVTTARVDTQFRESERWYDEKGRIHYIPPSCTKYGKVIISYRLIKFPSTKVIKSFILAGQAFSSTQVRYAYQCRITDPCGLLSEATYKAISGSLHSFKEYFPSYGYIYKLMTHKKDPSKRVAFITLGKNDGLKPGDKLEIIEYQQEKNPITGQIITEEKVITECVVAENELYSERAVCIIEGDNASKVKIKDIVKTK